MNKNIRVHGPKKKIYKILENEAFLLLAPSLDIIVNLEKLELSYGFQIYHNNACTKYDLESVATL